MIALGQIVGPRLYAGGRRQGEAEGTDEVVVGVGGKPAGDARVNPRVKPGGGVGAA